VIESIVPRRGGNVETLLFNGYEVQRIYVKLSRVNLLRVQIEKVAEAEKYEDLGPYYESKLKMSNLSVAIKFSSVFISFCA